MANHRIKKEIRDEILDKIKNKGISVVQAAKDYGISDKTIYNWLRTKATGVVPTREYIKLKKENEMLKTLLGELTIKLSHAEKNN